MSDNDAYMKRLRNLKQNREMSDEEFQEYYDKRLANAEPSAELERRIQRKLEDFAKDYDIDDLKINDRASLRALVQAEIALEDYEQIIYRIRQSGDLSQANVGAMDRIGKLMTDLRRDISSIQGDLNITRKIRKSDKEASVVSYIETLKQKAKTFYESRASYVYCPSCNMLLGTVWALYPESDNKFTFVCKRPLADNTKCNTKFTVSSRELLENKNTNNKTIMPESM